MKKEMHNEMDGLEELYKNSFNDFSIEPSKGLFEKINLAIPQSNASISLWVKYKTLIIIATTVAVITIAFFFYSNTSEQHLSAPLDKPTYTKSESENLTPSDNSKNSNSGASPSEITPNDKKEQKQYILSNSTQELIEEHPVSDEVELDNKAEIQSNEVPVIITEEAKPIEAEVKQEQKSGMDFYKKHSQNYKDSLRQLFAK